MSETAHKFDPSILREYDIRGVVGSTLHVADARAIGRTFGTLGIVPMRKDAGLGLDGMGFREGHEWLQIRLDDYEPRPLGTR